MNKQSINDYIDNLGTTKGYGEERDMDSQMINILTRYWPNNTARCSFVFDIDDKCETICLSDYIKADSQLELEHQCKEWYKNNLATALKIVLGWEKK